MHSLASKALRFARVQRGYGPTDAPESIEDRNIDRNWALTSFLDGARIVQPTFILAGELDGVVKMAAKDYDALESNVPNLWKKHLIPKAGHWVQQERLDEVNEFILNFLAGRAASSSN